MLDLFSLLRQNPGNAIGDARPTRATAALEPYKADGSRPALLLSTQTALTAAPALTPEGSATSVALDQRAEQLRTWVATRPGDALIWTAPGQLEERLGQPLRAVRADAESRVALGDLIRQRKADEKGK